MKECKYKDCDCESCEKERLARIEEEIFDEAYERYQEKLRNDFYEGRM